MFVARCKQGQYGGNFCSPTFLNHSLSLGAFVDGLGRPSDHISVRFTREERVSWKTQRALEAGDQR